MQLSKYPSCITLKYRDYHTFRPKMEDSYVILLIRRWADRIHITPSGSYFHRVKSSKLQLNWHWPVFQNGNLITSAIACHLYYSYTQLTTLLQTSALHQRIKECHLAHQRFPLPGQSLWNGKSKWDKEISSNRFKTVLLLDYTCCDWDKTWNTLPGCGYQCIQLQKIMCKEGRENGSDKLCTTTE